MFYHFRIPKAFLAFLLVLHYSLLSAQAPTGTDALWSELEEQIQKGNRRALRDLATFLDKPNYADATRHTLMRYTYFTKKEINLVTASREDFLGFFYENEKRLKFSEILKAFYTTPIEEQNLDTTFLKVTISDNQKVKTPPSVKVYFLSQKFDSLCQKRADIIDIQSVLREVINLKTPAAYEWLRHTLAAEPFGQQYSEAYYHLCEGLKMDASTESIEAILKAVDHKLVKPELLTSVFLQLTNTATSAQQTQYLLDSLGSLSAVRAYGYDRSLKFKEVFFYEKVDYYGKILSHPDIPDWILNNAIHDILTTHHPRVLFFLAAQVRLRPNQKDFYIELLKKLTNNVLVFQKGEDKNLSTEENEIEKWKNYVHWWAIHHNDFEWDNTTNRFLGKAEMVERTEKVEQLIRRLSSQNDSVALASFVQLTENDPSVVISTMEKFRPLLRSYNQHLPEINYPFLENMTLLAAFCRTNRISLEPTILVDSLLKHLTTTEEPANRYIIENQLIKSLSLKEITALEFYGLLYSTNLDINFSLSRILDIFYSKHWQEVITDEATLRLYIKKAVLFERIGTGGTSSLYNRKFDKNDKIFRERLERLILTETDTDVRKNILILLTPPSSLKSEDHNDVDTIIKKVLPFAEMLQILSTSPELSVNQINDFVSHPNYVEAYRPKLIQFLKKLTPLSTARQFKIKNYLSIKTDLNSFAAMMISPKELDDFISIFKLDSGSTARETEDILWSFINNQTARYSIQECGSFWNSMFKVPSFNTYIYEGAMMPYQKDSILSQMRKYLISNELLSEYEEQVTQMHIAELENIGRSLIDKLKSAILMDANNSIKVAVQSAILARLSYEDIGKVADYSAQLIRLSPSESPMRFLQTDFGIPLFSDDKQIMLELADNHKKLSRKDFYKFYLKQFGVDIWRSEGSLDFEKIFEILKYESNIPFTGGGTQRDYFTFGVIKLLELEFGTRLGFHEKLNENQTFYTYNTSKRAAAWRAFLLEKKLITLPPSVPPSFKS